jgi:hypothetical protein
MGIWEIIAGPILKIVDKLIPDPAAKAAAQLQIIQMQQAGEFKELEAQLEMAKGQTDTNKIEAGSTSLFVSGWRPFIGWICGLGLASQFIVGPFATWAATLIGHPVVFPTLDLGTLMTLLAGMLGLGTLRTVEKTQGVAAK